MFIEERRREKTKWRGDASGFEIKDESLIKKNLKVTICKLVDERENVARKLMCRQSNIVW